MRKSVVLMLLMLLAALIVAVPAAAASTPTVEQALATPTTTSTPVSPIISVTRCPGAPVARLKVGDIARPAQAYNTLWVSIYSNAIHTVLYRANGDTYTILGGPFCGEGPYNWYQVQYKNITGYVTEGTGSTYWVELTTASPITPTPTTGVIVTPSTPAPNTPVPTTTTPVPPVGGACAGAPAPRLKVGDAGQVAQVYSTLRQSIGSDAIVKVLLRSANDRFTVLEGPLCGYGPYNWYKVQHQALVGYVTEGTGSTYWIEPLPATLITPRAPELTPVATPSS